MLKKIFFIGVCLYVIHSCALYYMLPYGSAIHEGDAKGYFKTAQHFARKNTLSFSGKLQPVGYGYPFLLGVFFKLFSDSFLTIFFLNILLGIAGLYGLLKISDVLFPQSYVSACIAWWYVVHSGVLLYTQCALTEIMLFTLYIWFIERMIHVLQEQKIYYAVQAALLLGLSLIVKPAAWFYGIFLIITGFLAFLGGIIPLTVLVSFSGIFLFSAGAYLTSNYFLFDTFGFPTIMERNLLYLFLPKVYALTNMISFERAVIVLKNYTAQERFGLLLSAWRDYPVKVLSVWFFNMIKTFCGFYTHHFVLIAMRLKTGISFFAMSTPLINRCFIYCFDKGSIMTFILGFSEILFRSMQILGIIGVVRILFNKKQYLILFLSISFMGYFLGITGADGCARLRMMVEPFLLLAAAYASSLIISEIKQYVLKNKGSLYERLASTCCYFSWGKR